MKKLLVIALLALCTAAFGQQKKLVVTPFENRGAKIDAAALNNLQDFLINVFINTGRFQVPDRNALALLAAEQKFQLSDWADDKKSAEMGKVLNADYIVRIIAVHDGETNVLMARILDVNTANGLSGQEMEFSDQRDARSRLDNFVKGILQRIDGWRSAGNPREKLVVPPFENRGVKLDAAALNNLQDFLINAIIKTGWYQVPDRSALDLLAKEQKFQLSDWADDKKSAELGKVLNADYIARVIVIPDGDAFTLMMRILDVSTANGLSAAEMDFTTQRDARGKMENFAKDILQRNGRRGPAGGWIFYDKGVYSDGWRYLEAAPAETEFTAQWGAYEKDVGGTGTAVGSGKRNTELIVNYLRQIGESEKAAQRCVRLSFGGFRDWFLPSRDELDLMYKNLKQKGLGGFSDNSYWSSSQSSTDYAWGQNFSNGSQYYYFFKSYTSTVRAVRAF